MSERLPQILAHWVLAGSVCLLAPACLSGSMNRVDRQGQPTAEHLEACVPGQSSMTECLEALGAPLVVRPYKKNSIELIWGWQRSRFWSLTLSVPIADRGDSSLSFARGMQGAHGLTLRFDAQGRLFERREGRLKDLLQSLRPPNNGLPETW
ncbi:MAG: hypothetical protein R3F17_10910 [Planctomycetota bacterium]